MCVCVYGCTCVLVYEIPQHFIAAMSCRIFNLMAVSTSDEYMTYQYMTYQYDVEVYDFKRIPIDIIDTMPL